MESIAAEGIETARAVEARKKARRELTHKRSIKITAILSSMEHDCMLNFNVHNRNQR